MIKIKTFKEYADDMDKRVNAFLEQQIIIHHIQSIDYGSRGMVTQIVYEEGTEGSKFKEIPKAYQAYTESDTLDIQRQE